MPASTVEITAIYRSERFRFENPDGDVLIADADFVGGPHPNGAPKFFALKGPDVDFSPQQTYRFYGRWSKYKNKRTGDTEDQFHFQAAVKSQPQSRAGVIRYIEQAGKGNGIGRGKATKLWQKFGADSVRILREQPDVAAAAVAGLSVDQAKLTGAELEKLAHIESCSIELMGLLDRRGFPKATAKRCLDLWGNQAAELIQRNPYALMRFRGCGFKLTDAMYLDLGHDPARLKRQALCAWHKIASDSGGHTWFPVEYAIRGIQESVAGAELRPADALLLAKRAGAIDVSRTDERGRFIETGGRIWVAEGKKARSERFLARRIVELMSD